MITLSSTPRFPVSCGSVIKLCLACLAILLFSTAASAYSVKYTLSFDGGTSEDNNVTEQCESPSAGKTEGATPDSGHAFSTATIQSTQGRHTYIYQIDFALLGGSSIFQRNEDDTMQNTLHFSKQKMDGVYNIFNYLGYAILENASAEEAAKDLRGIFVNKLVFFEGFPIIATPEGLTFLPVFKVVSVNVTDDGHLLVEAMLSQSLTANEDDEKPEGTFSITITTEGEVLMVEGQLTSPAEHHISMVFTMEYEQSQPPLGQTTGDLEGLTEEEDAEQLEQQLGSMGLQDTDHQASPQPFMPAAIIHGLTGTFQPSK